MPLTSPIFHHCIYTILYLQIRLFTTPTSSPELIRLWLERSGHNIPLDIEIYLRAVEHPCMLSNPCLNFHIDAQRQRGRRSYGFGESTATSWPSFASHNGCISSIPRSDEPREVFPNLSNKPNVYWAHIAFYYLVAQMPRWERFVFRYDKAFKAMTALASINGQLMRLILCGFLMSYQVQLHCSKNLRYLVRKVVALLIGHGFQMLQLCLQDQDRHPSSLPSCLLLFTRFPSGGLHQYFLCCISDTSTFVLQSVLRSPSIAYVS